MPLRSRLSSKRVNGSKDIPAKDQYNKSDKPQTAESMSDSIKGNDGKARMWRRYLPVVAVLGLLNLAAAIFLYQMVWSYSPDDLESTTLKAEHNEILEKYWTLIDLDPGISLRKTSSSMNRYGPVRATFCQIDWDLQAENPSTIPMFRDLEANSYFCKKTKRVVADFYNLVKAAKAYDGFVEGSEVGNNHNGGVFPPNGVVFHETRCGSTLFANLMASFAPGLSRVYSESPPPPRVLGACQNGYGEYCDEDLHHQLIRDVFYMMGRRPPPEENDESNYLFFKLQSINAMNIDKFAKAMPEVPWVFVYRDTVEIMQSHTNQGARPVPSHVCTRYMKYSPSSQPDTTMQIIEEAGTSLGEMSEMEYCAAHLAGLSLAAVQEYDRTHDDASAEKPGGQFVNYYQMPDVVWEKIFPDHFDVNPLPANAVSNMQATAGVYSKGRGQKANREWTEDSTIKRQTATPEVIEAAERFASGVFKRMKELSSSA